MQNHGRRDTEDARLTPDDAAAAEKADNSRRSTVSEREASPDHCSLLAAHIHLLFSSSFCILLFDI